MRDDGQSSRRLWLVGCGAAAVAAAGCHSALRASAPKPAPAPAPLPLTEFRPGSALQARETRIEQARFPVIDVHTHLSWGGGTLPMKLHASPAELLAVMNRKNVRTMVHVTGGFGPYLAEGVRVLERAHPGRFHVFTEPMWKRIEEPGYPDLQAQAIHEAHRAGARGLKVMKLLGLFLREQGGAGALVKVDDPRFDPMWEACGHLGVPVAIHVGDPAAFFHPTDHTNERYEELQCHPDWSFHGRDFPTQAELLQALNRVIARHPRTRFLGLHVGNAAEDLGYVGECLDRFPNLDVEIAARINELGRQPRAARRFFDRYQDRILFGTDAVPGGHETPQQVFGDALYEIYFRFLETEDEYFDYAPAPVPPQGRWRISGLGLPDTILRKVYLENAQRLLGIT